MKRRILVSFFLVFMMLFGRLAFAADDTVLAKIGNKTITQSDFDRIISYYPEEQRKAIESNPKIKFKLLRGVVQWIVISDIAKKKGFDKKPEIKKELELALNRFLAGEYLAWVMGQSVDVTDKDIKQYYEANKQEFKSPERVEARHILFKVAKDATEKQKKEVRKKAELVLKKIRNGADFAKLAEEYSDDPGSKSRGGLLGYFARGRMVKPFEKVAFSLKPGEVSDIVETRFGYHIIKVEKRQPAGILPLDQVKDRIKRKLFDEFKRAKISEYVEKAMKKADVKIFQDKLVPAKTQSK